jgi:murein DD-endopeptidase MepM/ murein hydrolase activator NlpD
MKVQVVFFILFVNVVFSQRKLAYPLDNIVVTGNYAELRPNHFHAGLDLRTDPSKNLPIYSVDDGYVSRIKVSTYGYGKVFYITHPGGIQSVYAHQHHFADKIENYIRAKQKEKETFEIEIYPDKNALPVKKGEIIGFTGNTGSSQAPHLHFELRDEKTEVALNPFLYFDFLDEVAPDLSRIYFFETTDLNWPQVIVKKDIAKAKTTLSGKNQIKEHHLTETILLPECSGFGFTAFDQHLVNGSSNQIYAAELQIDGQIYYKHVFDSIAFDKSKYINCFTELGTKQSQKIQKCFLSKNEDFKIFRSIKGNGELYLKDTLEHAAKLILSDANGNKTITNFKIKRIKHTELVPKVARKYDCNKEITLIDVDAKVLFKEKTFFNDVDVYLTKRNKERKSYLYNVDANVQGIFLPFTVKIKPFNQLPDTSKLCVIEKNSNTYCGGQMEGDYVVGTSKKTGSFYVSADTTSPNVSEIKKSKKSSGSKLEFTVSDNLSGIGDFKLYINGKWYYLEFESKSARLFCNLDNSIPKGQNTFLLKVWDKRNNLRELKGTFYR